MRLTALAVVGFISSTCDAAIRPRRPSAPTYPGYSRSANTSSYGLTGTLSSTPSTSPYLSPSDTQTSDSVYSPESSTEAPASSSSLAAYSSPATKQHLSTAYPLPSSQTESPTGYPSSSSPIKSPTARYPSSSAKTYPISNSTTKAPSKCSGQTLNVLGASLDWWYTRTIYNVVSTISVQFNRNDSTTGWTVLPATTPFDLSSALASPICTSSLTYDTYYNISLYDVSCTPAPTPVAASTTLITQTAYSELSATTGTGPIPDVVSTPPPATITIPSSGGEYAEGTAFVYFSAYEIITKIPTTYGNGSAGCAQATQTYPMDEPFSFEYADGDVNGTLEVGAGVTGDVAPAFLDVVSESGAVAGSWVAAPTVAIVVQDIYVAEAVLAAAFGSLKKTETVLQTPEPTLPSGFTPGPGQTKLPPGETTGRIESTAASLAVPTEVFPGPGRTTTPNDNRPTKPPGEVTPTPGTTERPPPGGNTRPPPVGNTSPNEGPGSGPAPTNTQGSVENIISAVLGAATPTNALEVLQQAENSLTRDSATASAILQGLNNKPDNQNNQVGTGPDGKPTLVIDGSTITADSKTQFNVGTATLTPGGIVTMSGTTLSLASDFSAVVINGVTHTAPSPFIPAPTVFTFDGRTYTANNGPTQTIGGETLTSGGVITVAGSTISLGPSGVVVNGVTQSLGSATASPASITAPPVLTIGGETFTALNNGLTYDINGETLTPGELETVTVDGHTYAVSLGPGATVLVIETIGANGEVSSTMYETLVSGSWSQATVTSTVNMAASSAVPSATASYSVQPALQGAGTSIRTQIGWMWVGLATLALAVWL